MEIKAYSFEQNSHAFADIKRTVAECVKENTVYFESFSDPKEMFTDISECIDNTDVILLGVETKVYLKFKPILIKAFNFTPAYSDDISKAIGDLISDEKTLKAHSLVPNESTELISKDGLYSGFYIKDGDQYIIVFPLDDTVVPYILEKSGLPFFNVPEDKGESLQQIMDTSAASAKAQQLVDKIKENNIRISIPSTPAARLLKEDIRACEGYGEYIFFTPFVNDAGIEDPKQYSAQLAKGAMELRSTELGATVSNIFREKNGDTVVSYYAFISVATADKIVVKKLFADSGESIDNLIVEATNELYSMINKYVDETIFKITASAEEIAKYEQSLIEAEVVSDIKPKNKKSKKGLIIAIIFLIIAIIAAVVSGLYFSGFFVTSSDAPGNDTLQQNSNTTQQAQTQQINPFNTVAEITEITSETSIFGVTTTIPTPQPNTNYNIYYPNTNSTSTTSEQTTATPSTQAPTTQPTTVPTTEATNNDDIIII